MLDSGGSLPQGRSVNATIEDMPASVGDRPKWDGRAVHGSWKQPAQVVEQMVARGWGISEAVRKVVEELGIPCSYALHAFAGIRGAFYQRKKKQKLHA